MSNVFCRFVPKTIPNTLLTLLVLLLRFYSLGWLCFKHLYPNFLSVVNHIALSIIKSLPPPPLMQTFITNKPEKRKLTRISSIGIYFIPQWILVRVTELTGLYKNLFEYLSCGWNDRFLIQSIFALKRFEDETGQCFSCQSLYISRTFQCTF